ncbi:hypothetical protein IPA_04110 [Ignicoccus pacificus DSM 13166]|uniref:Ferrous iron transport protein B n=1 Tax=Ignicoccus pacificus DSM 13166 TaxID=940294 RepID=A0A977PK25_9CREN|nr:hypothetical protein IPA_04110 [Ignicoccus pacificus DSM 13166]
MAGQPNVGKSTFINSVLGSYVSHVANWPGVTVSINVIEALIDNEKVCLIDLPGTNSLSGGSEEERIAARFLIEEDYDNVVIVVDAVVLKRSMYLALQILELRGIGVIAINKIDMALKAGIHINKSLLEKRLQKPVVLMSAADGEGVDEVIRKAMERQHVRYLDVNYGDLEYYITMIEKELYGKVKGNPRWYAAEFMLGNKVVEEKLKALEVYEKLVSLREEAKKELGDLGKIVIESRWKKIEELLSGVIEKERVVTTKESKILEWMDKIMLHPILGIIASFLILFTIMSIAFTVNTGFPLNIIMEAVGRKDIATLLEHYSISGILGEVFNAISVVVKNALPPPVGSLIGDGIILGVGTVLSFFPLVFTVYLLLALLEDSGLASRIAVAMDPLFRPAGLSGKAVFPIVISMGCNVAGVPTARVMRTKSAKIATIIPLPLVPCQARLVVLLALASVLPGMLKALSILYVYTLALGLFLIIAAIIKKIIGSDEVEELIMEIPPYHVPKLRVISWIAWDNAKHFLEKAGTVILIFSVILWFLVNTGPQGFVNSIDQSWGAIIGKALEYIPMAVLGLGKEASWIVSLSMLVGTVAKEVVLETLAILTGTSNVYQMVTKLGLSVPQVLGLMVAITLYIPCVATIAVIRSETGSWKWTLLSIVISITLSMVVSYITVSILRLW